MAPSSGLTWEITGQREEFGQSEGSPPGQGFRVTFRTGTNLSGSVFVLESEYTPDRVRGLVDAKARAMQAIANLASS